MSLWTSLQTVHSMGLLLLQLQRQSMLRALHRQGMLRALRRHIMLRALRRSGLLLHATPAALPKTYVLCLLSRSALVPLLRLPAHCCMGLGSWRLRTSGSSSGSRSSNCILNCWQRQSQVQLSAEA